MNKLLTALMASIFLFTSCSAPGEGEGAEARSLSLVSVYPANTTDPHLVQTAFILNSGTVETLAKLDPETGALSPGLATDWSRSGRTWELAIRGGVKFHNGKELTADMVRKSLERAIEKNPGMEQLLPIEAMEAEGQTLRITTKTTYPGLISELVHFNTAIIDTEADIDLPVGTGPFKFDSFDINGNAELSRFDEHWEGRAKLARVTMSANQDANARLLSLKSGEADIIYRPSTESIDELDADSSFIVETTTGTRVYHLLYAFDGPHASLWAKKSFRQAMDALIDREGIAQTVMTGYGQATDNPFPADSALSPEPDPRESGREEALRLFEEAGLEVNDGRVTHDGKPLKMDIMTYVARPELPQIAQVLENAGSEVGIEFSIVTAENIDEALIPRTWDLATYSVNTVTRGDGSYFFHGSLTPGGAQNHGHLDDPKLNSLIETFNGSDGEKDRMEIAREIALHMREEQLNSYVVTPEETAAYSTDVKGWVTPPNEFEYPMITKDLDRD